MLLLGNVPCEILCVLLDCSSVVNTDRTNISILMLRMSALYYSA